MRGCSKDQAIGRRTLLRLVLRTQPRSPTARGLGAWFGRRGNFRSRGNLGGGFRSDWTLGMAEGVGKQGAAERFAGIFHNLAEKKVFALRRFSDFAGHWSPGGRTVEPAAERAASRRPRRRG